MKQNILFIPVISLLASIGAQGAITYDDNVSNVIFGTNTGNGAFTVTRESIPGLELALRAKTRFPVSNGTYNSNGDGSYTHPAGTAGTFGFVSGSDGDNTPVWNFDWSVNTDYNGTSGRTVGFYTYRLSLDADPGVGVTNFLAFDQITPANPGVSFFDHSFGDNMTTTATDSKATNGTEYETLLATKNLVQNSWSYEFFDDQAPLTGFTAAPGEYTIKLEAFEGGNLIGETSMNVVMIPEPSTAIVAVMGLSVLGFRRRRN